MGDPKDDANNDPKDDAKEDAREDSIWRTCFHGMRAYLRELDCSGVHFSLIIHSYSCYTYTDAAHCKPSESSSFSFREILTNNSNLPLWNR